MRSGVLRFLGGSECHWCQHPSDIVRVCFGMGVPEVSWVGVYDEKLDFFNKCRAIPIFSFILCKV